MRIESNIVRLTESLGNREVEIDVSITACFRETGITSQEETPNPRP